MPTRSRDAARTRAELLNAARRQFAREGYDRVTVRSVAAEVGVNQALVMRYFGTKANLFAEAARLRFHPPDLSGVAHADIADVLVDNFFSLYDDEQDTFIALLRCAATSPVAAAQMLGVVREAGTTALASAAVDRPEQRAALVGAQIIGFAFARYVLGAPPLVAMDRDQVRAWLGPVLTRYLTDPELGPDLGPDLGPGLN